MTQTEQYLYRYYQLERLKSVANNDLRRAVAEYNERAESLLKPKTMTEPQGGRTNRVSDPVQDAVVAMVDTYLREIKKAEEALNKLIAEQDSISETVEKAGLNVMEKSYVLMRYFKGNRTWQTAQHMQYSERQANRYRVSALQKIQSVMKDGR